MEREWLFSFKPPPLSHYKIITVLQQRLLYKRPQGKIVI